MKLMYFSLDMPDLYRDAVGTFGGAPVQWKSWIDGFLSNGDEFALLTYKGANEYIGKKVNIDVIESYDPQKGIKWLRNFTYRIPALFRAIKKYNPDYIIQVSASMYTGYIMIAAKLAGVPFIHRVASDVHIDERLDLLIEKREILLYKMGLRYCDYLFVQNNYQYEKTKLKYPNKKIFLIHNPYTIETKFEEIKSKKERNFIAWVGHFRQIKNLPALLNAAKLLTEINFKIAGIEYPNLDDTTKNTILELKKLTNVEFVGHIPRKDIVGFLSKSIALLNTSFTEGFSNTFLEAWSCGTPIITTPNANPDDLITRFNLGFVAQDFEEIPQIIEELLYLNSESYTKLSKNCYLYVKDNHNPQILAKKFTNYLMNH